MVCREISRAALCCLLSLMLAAIALAGTTGKIAGRLTDKASGDPLGGANITIEGTTMGAASNIDGYFTILNVPPGVYKVRASMIGYGTIIVSNVRAQIDLTTTVDFAMEEQAITGGEITVVAERKLVQEDVASSVASLSGSEVQELPLTTVNEVMQLQAGVESGQNGLVIRGGSADEALFLVDGFTLRDPRNNQPLTGIPLSAVQEIELKRGGFNAEYGQVRSGLINIVTKEGERDKYNGALTLKYSPPGAKHFDLSPYDPNSMWLRPYLDPAVAFVGTENGAWDQFTQRQYPRFEGWNAISQRLLTDNDPANDLTPAAAQRLFLWQHRKQEITDEPDYDIDAGFGGPAPVIGDKLGNLRFYASVRKKREMLLIPMTRDDYSDYDWLVKLTSDLKPSMKLSLQGILGKSYSIAVNGTEQINSAHYIRTPAEIVAQITQFPFTSSSRVFSNSYFSLAQLWHRGLAASLTHTLGAKTFYDLNVEYFERRYETGPIAERNKSQLVEVAPGVFADSAPFGWSASPDVGIGDGILFGGHTSTARDTSKSFSTKIKFDLTSQVNFNNEIKTGFEFVYDDLDFNYGIVNVVFPEGNIYIDQQWKPFRAAAYLQDKLEFKGFIANLGLRLDYSNANTDWVRVALFDPSFLSDQFDENAQYPAAHAKAQWSLSPRVGISHPITANSKLFFNYGHFKQLPTNEELFLYARGRGGELERYGDPDLTLAKTISYELGYDQALFDTYLIQLAGYYHDVTDQLAFTSFQSAQGDVNYQAARSESYEDILGFEATLRKARGRWWTGFATYTYQVRSFGRFGRAQVFEDPSQQRFYNNSIVNFVQDKPRARPRANLVLNFYTPDKFGPSLLGANLLSNWQLNLLTDWQAGWHITWNPNQTRGIAQNLQLKDFYNLDLRLSKGFKFGPLNATLLMDVTNLFNTRRITQVGIYDRKGQLVDVALGGFYDFNDQLDYFNSLHLPASKAYNNIAGKDRPGDFRKPGVEFQPIVKVTDVHAPGFTPTSRPFYYETSTGSYWQYANGSLQEVPRDKLQKVLDDKAYIDMPNETAFTFLNPRNVFIGIRTSFDF